MTLRVRRIKTDAITATATMAAPSFGASADLFRGVFVELVTSNGTPKTESWLASQPNDTIDFYTKGLAYGVLDNFASAVGLGKYGGNALAINCNSFTFTTNYPTSTNVFTSATHDLANESAVILSRLLADGGTLPAGTDNASRTFESKDPHIMVQVSGTTFKLSKQITYAASDSGGDLLITAAGHGYQNDDTIAFRHYNPNTPPGGLSQSTNYWVISATTDTFKLSLSQGGAAIAYSAGTGTTWIHLTSDGDVVYSDNGTGTGSHWMTSTGYPSFWCIKAKSNGSSVVNVSGLDKFTGPTTGRPYNRFEYEVIYPTGFRVSDPPVINGDGYNTGTYHAADASNSEENSNYHFYFLSIIRHDIANGRWVTVKHSSAPTSQRSVSGADPGDEPICTFADANFMGSLTRWYIDHNNRAQPAEVDGNYTVYYDRFRLFYEDEQAPVTFAWDNFPDATAYVTWIRASVNTDIPFTLTNSSGSNVIGKIRNSYPNGHNAQILNSGLSVVGPNDDVTVPASGTWTGYLRVTHSTTSLVNTHSAGVVFVPNSQIQNNAKGDSYNHSDTAFTCDWSYVMANDYGPLDCSRAGHGLRIMKGLDCTFDSSTDRVSCVGHGLGASNDIAFAVIDAGDSLPTGTPVNIQANTKYYPVEILTDSFKISETSGGAAIDLTSNGTTTSGFFIVARSGLL